MASYYPPVGFHFKVEFTLAGMQETDTRFQEVSGLTAELGIEEVPRAHNDAEGDFLVHDLHTVAPLLFL